MSDTVEKAIFYMVELFIFITACIFIIGGINEQERTLNVVHQSVKQEDRRLFTDLKDKGNETYTGAEVLMTIYHIKELNANIRVDGKEIEELDTSSILLTKSYQVEYIYDSNGTVLTIVFS
ncbi:hypothetical protein V3851_00070 [Paenibacillus sp. M1]|uniref:Uncharacterized protein n=1 Tax=Paenibacillus haidiansis TaxID=1574488 RepID=A0ABU7VKA9_9BACL